MKISQLVSRACLVLSVLAGASNPVFGAAEEKIVSTPALNTEATAKVGDEILHQGTYYEREVIHLSQEIKVGENGAYTLTPGYYLRTGGENGWGYYVAAKGPGSGKVIKVPGVVTLQPAFQVSDDGKTVGVITNYYQAVRGEANGISRSTEPAVSRESIQKTIVYGGKKGSKIKLGYQDIWMSIERPSEIRFVEYDIAKSKIVESNGARIEIISATGDSIRYRVMKSFG